jgi:hypothetical protein
MHNAAVAYTYTTWGDGVRWLTADVMSYICRHLHDIPQPNYTATDASDKHLR